MRKMRWTCAVSCVSILFFSAAGWALPNRGQAAASTKQGSSEKQIFSRRPFSADMAMTPGRNSSETLHGKIYAGNHAMRMEMQMRGMESISIVRYDKKVVWILMPAQQRYMEMPITGRAGVVAQLRDPDMRYEIQDLGSDKVGDYACEKYRVHWTGQGESHSGLVWVGTSGYAKGFVVRTQDDRTGAVTEFQNIRPGEPDAALFEIPAGYQKMEMPGMPGMPRH